MSESIKHAIMYAVELWFDFNSIQLSFCTLNYQKSIKRTKIVEHETKNSS